MTDTDTEKLLHQAMVAAQLGRRERARTLFNQIVALDPENVEAWLGLAGVVEEPKEKQRIYETVLAIDPEHPVAREGLRQLRRDLQSTVTPKASTMVSRESETRETGQSSSWPVLRYEDGVPIYACAYHPDRETTLRCNRCGKPICTECAILTDVGYRCPDCVAELTGRFYHAQPRHVVSSLVAASLLGLIVGVLSTIATAFIGFWAIFVAAPLAGVVAEGIWRAGARHRARKLNLYASVVVLLTGLLGISIGSLFVGGAWLFSLIMLAFIVVTVYQRLR